MPKPIDNKPDLSGLAFRPKMHQDTFLAFLKENKEPGYIYKGVATNLDHLEDNVDRHLEAGYEFVYSTKPMADDRTFSPGSETQDSIRPQLVLKTTKDGKTQYVMMRISEQKANEMTEQRIKAEHEKYMKSVKNLKNAKGSVHYHAGETKF